jgi:hypothetical protein
MEDPDYVRGLIRVYVEFVEENSEHHNMALSTRQK